MQDEVNQDYSEQNEVDGMKKGADSTGKVMHTGWPKKVSHKIFPISLPNIDRFSKFFHCCIL